MSSKEQNPLPQGDETGALPSWYASLAGPRPTLARGRIHMALDYDPAASKSFLLIRISLTMPDGSIDHQTHVCRALPVESRLDDRENYLQHQCEMFAQYMPEWMSLKDVQPAIDAMVQDWNIFDPFLFLSSLNPN